MKKIFFIENQNDFETVRAFIKTDTPGDSKKIVINCNSGFKLNVQNDATFEYREEGDYDGKIDKKELNFTPQNDLRKWFNDIELKKIFKISSYDLSSIFLYELTRGLTTSYKFADLLCAVIRNEVPDEVFTVPEKKPTHNIRFTKNDKLIPALIDPVLESMKAEFPQIQSVKISSFITEEPKPLAFSLKSMFSSSVRFILEKIQIFINFKLNKTGNSRLILFKGAPRLIFPLMDKLKGNNFKIAYFQYRIAPRLLKSLFNKKAQFWTLPKENSARFKPFWIEKKHIFDAVIENRKMFFYHDVNLRPLLADKFDFLFMELLPKLQDELGRVENLLKMKKPAAIILDEENSNSSMCLILTAQALGIPTLEYQHGAIYHYHLQNKAVDRYLLWGEFFNKKLQRELSVAAEKITVVGPIHLTSVVHSTSHAPRWQKARPDDRLILYTTHSFNKGSRGGLHNVHMTRNEAETILNAICKEMIQTPQTYLIVKLHPEDKNMAFYTEFLRSFSPSIRFTVVRDLSVYDLIHSADFLISPPSTTVLEAIILNKPVLLVDFEKKRSIFPFAEWQAVLSASNDEEFHFYFQELVKKPFEILKNQKEGRDKILQDYISWDEAKSASSFVNLMKDLSA